MKELEIKIVKAMREASEERLAKALEYLHRLELEEKHAASPQSTDAA